MTPIGRNSWAAVVGWTLIVAGSLVWGLVSAHRQILEMVRLEAVAYIDKDIAFRSWAASHGGVYVPPTATTPPNPYLKGIPDRDVVTTGGRALTLMNPAYMLRELQTHSNRTSTARERLVSLKAINPVNAPDPWERQALERFERGEAEFSEVSDLEGRSRLRLIRPLYIERACLKCHEWQGYKVGDVRGGISVAIDLAPFEAAERQTAGRLAAGHAAIWFAGLIGIGLFDRRARRRAAEARDFNERLRQSAREIEDLYDQAPCGYHSVDQDGLFLRMNATELQWLGYAREEVIGRLRMQDLLTPASRQVFDVSFPQFRKTGFVRDLELDLQRRDGTVLTVLLSATAIFDADGRFVMSRSTLYDISERKAAAAQIEFLAQHDALTELPNRVLVEDRLGQAVAYADRVGSKLALLFIDLDNFKTVNDSLSHAVGDALLKAVAVRLRESVRQSDTVSRHGGDEFVILLVDIGGTEGAVAVANKIIGSLAEPFLIDAHEVSISVSVGVVMYPDDGRSFDVLIRRADIAMYQAKEAGRNTFRFFDAAMNVDASERLELRNALRRALDQGEFVLHYQPQIRLSDGRVVGAEALIRWQHPERGLVPPGRFIDVAEDSGLIVPIGEWVLARACEEAAGWARAGLDDLVVAVNLSAVQFRRGNLEQTVVAALSASGLDPELLELELTESILIRDDESVPLTIQRLKSLGVKVSVDDFGTGYSSLAYLKRFAIDKLKIDQSFVRKLASERDDAAIVRAIIQIARSLGLGTVAEGVEDEQTVSFLRLHRCDEAQGYFFARPMPAADFVGFVRDRQG